MFAFNSKRTSIAPFAMELEPASNVIGGMRATLFHNPTAGQKATKDDILAAMKLADFDVRYVSVKDDNFEEAFEKKADLLVVAGGDGTIAEVLTSNSGSMRRRMRRRRSPRGREKSSSLSGPIPPIVLTISLTAIETRSRWPKLPARRTSSRSSFP